MKKILMLLLAFFIMSLFPIASAHEYQQWAVPDYQTLGRDDPPPGPQPEYPPPKHKKKKPPKDRRPVPPPEEQPPAPPFR